MRARGDGAAATDEPLPPAAAEASPSIDNRLFVLVLQHPQERGEPRGTAAPMVAALRRARLAVGLSWPNLGRALGRPAGSEPVDPRRWGVLYLGSARPFRPPAAGPANGGAIVALDHGGKPLPEGDADRLLRALDGIVLLDGTWSQAKTLWWRNPWLLKLPRLVLNPPAPARFGRLRREPRHEALSTLEAAALVLRHTEPGPRTAELLLAMLDRLIAAHAAPRQTFRECDGGDLPARARRRSRAGRARRSPRYRDRSATE
jgi:DTW domain-containing protein YfiP